MTIWFNVQRLAIAFKVGDASGDDMASSDEYIRLYGFLRKELLARYFALGRERRNDFYQESTSLPLTREQILALPPDERAQALWRKVASRENPWLFGCKLTVALATEARLGLPAAEPLLGRIIRSCERLFPFSGIFRGLPLRCDPVTSDDWGDPPPGQSERLPTQFLGSPLRDADTCSACRRTIPATSPILSRILAGATWVRACTNGTRPRASETAAMSAGIASGRPRRTSSWAS